MANQQLLDYIKQQLEGGVGREEIKSALIKNGWMGTDIDEGFLSINPQQEVPENTGAPQTPVVLSSPAENNSHIETPADAVVSTPTTSTLIGIGELYRRSWNIYRSRFWVLMGISALPFILAFIVGILSILFEPSNTLSLAIWVLSLLIFLVGLWSYISILYAVKDGDRKIGIIESFGMGWKKLFSYWWLTILEGVIITGGLVLLIIPGILFSVWFFLSAYVLISEETNGLDALMKSKEYVRGKWWGVFGRALSLVIPTLIFGMFVGMFLIFIGYTFKSVEYNFVIQTINFFILPFYLAYGFSLYKSLKEVRGEFVFNPKKGRGKFIAIGILGGLVIPMIILSSVTLSSLNSGRIKGLSAERTIQINELKSDIKKYSIDNEKLPSSLKELVPRYSSQSNTLDPLTKLPLYYTYKSDNSYEVCAAMGSKIEKCAKSPENAVFETNQSVDNGSLGNINSSTNEEYIKRVIAVTKSRTSFPLKIDATRTLVDIIAKPNTFYYKYRIESTRKWSDGFLKDSMVAGLCNTKRTHLFFARNINLEYSVLITNTNKTYTASISKKDCSATK